MKHRERIIVNVIIVADSLMLTFFYFNWHYHAILDEFLNRIYFHIQHTHMLVSILELLFL